MGVLQWLYTADSSDLQSLLLGCLILLILRWLMTRPKSYYNLPPGPTPFPIIGNLPQMITTKDVTEKLDELRQKYGNIFKIRIGSFSMVVVAGTELITEGLVKKGESLKGRPTWLYIVQKLFQGKGVIFNTGKEWKDLRKFAITTLRDLGMGKRSLEDQIQTEITELTRVLQSYNDKPFCMKKPIANSTLSIMHSVIFGQRIEHGKPEFEEIIDSLEFLFMNAGVFLPENFFPWIRFLRWRSPADILIQNEHKLRRYVYEKIYQHEETFDANNIRDFVDMYLLMIQSEKSESFSEQNIFRTIVDLFSAGSETNTTTLIWAFLYMAKYPEIQKQCREEIKEVTNMNRIAKMEDKMKMPFVMATISEVQRVAPAVPTTPPHAAIEDTTIGGYDIPKDTIVAFMIMSAHKDPNYWKDPDEFLPNRWLGEDGQLIKHEAFMPFSLGPRNCLGEPLARMELFLIFTNMLQQFEFHSVDNEPVSLKSHATGITYNPQKNIICAKPI